MKKMIYGIGNHIGCDPNIRHNAGFLFVDTLCEMLNISWQEDKCYKISNYNDILICKNKGYINENGEVVYQIIKNYNFKAEDIIVAHDELDLPEGKIKFKKSGGLNGHNGLRSIAANLNTKQFNRIRIGIGRPADNTKISDYVLDEMPVNKIKEQIMLFISTEDFLKIT